MTLPYCDSRHIFVDNCLNPTLDGREVLTTIRDVSITRKIMRCLCPRSWLVSDVINAYLILLSDQKRSQKCYFFNTWFYSKLTEKGYCYSLSISRWLKKIGYSIFECDKVFVPIHLSCHWTLVVVDLKQMSFTYFDSYHLENTVVLDNLAQYIVDEARNQQVAIVHAKSRIQVFPKNIPKQDDCYNCGMFLIMFAYCESLKRPYRFDWSNRNESRREVVLQLMQKNIE